MVTPIPITSNLFLIPLDQPITGFTNFISSWLYRGEKTFLIDPGPSGTMPHLLHALDVLDVRHVDAVLLTHIHIDHAGGVRALVNRFPDTPVVCHAAGMPHLTNPTRLWEGSRKVLGAVAEAYGEIQPVPPGLMVDAARYDDHGIQVIATPGHAPHHVSYLLGPYLFAGEAGGVFLALSKGKFFLRPATPPRFFLDTSIQSLDALLSRTHESVCYGHFGISNDTPRLLEAHRGQLYRWAEIISREIKKKHSKDLESACFESLLENDPLLACWHLLTRDVQERERGFLRNSIRGFVQYLQEVEKVG